MVGEEPRVLEVAQLIRVLPEREEERIEEASQELEHEERHEQTAVHGGHESRHARGPIITPSRRVSPDEVSRAGTNVYAVSSSSRMWSPGTRSIGTTRGCQPGAARRTVPTGWPSTHIVTVWGRVGRSGIGARSGSTRTRPSTRAVSAARPPVQRALVPSG